MGKLAAFASGVGEGYLGARRYLDTKKRAEKQDELFEKALAAGKATDPAKSSGVGSPADPQLSSNPAAAAMGMTEEEARAAGFRADGGMIMPLPNHHDKMMWQRASFKK